MNVTEMCIRDRNYSAAAAITADADDFTKRRKYGIIIARCAAYAAMRYIEKAENKGWNTYEEKPYLYWNAGGGKEHGGRCSSEKAWHAVYRYRFADSETGE